LAGLLAFATLLAACGGGGDGTSTANGQLRIRLTDSQSCNYESVFVTVTEVRVSQSSTASDSDSGWETLTLSPARQVDLMKLRNGAFEELGTLPLPAGTYQQVRLLLASNGASAPYANYLTLPGAAGAPIALKTPSAQQSGLKLNVHATVDPGQLAELTLDFDPCKSVVKAGNSGKYNLKPVVTAHTNAVNDIEGYTVPGAIVSAQQGGVGLKATTADLQGRFVLWPVDAGTYDLVITGTGLANAVLAGVQVSTGKNLVNAQAAPLLPQPSPIFRQASGTVTVTGLGGNAIDAELRALQQLGTYPGSATPLLIETARTLADDLLGTYAFSLPTAAPQRAFWQSGVTSYVFAKVDDQAGQYAIEARAAGFDQPKVKDVSLGLGKAPSTDFEFP